MEQMYLIEIFIDKVSIFVPEGQESGANKKLIIKARFGPNVQFIIKEGQLAPVPQKDDIIECDAQGRRKFSRIIRVGKSYLFPSYPDTLQIILSKFPLEIEVWNDDDKEEPIYVGIGTMHWDTKFYYMLKETADICKLHDPLSIKQCIPLMAECCCAQCGEICFILRLSALGDSITTEFQQLMTDPEQFCFRTNKVPSMFQCKRIEGDDPNFVMVGSLYETTTLEDPDIIADANKKIEVCTELQSCAFGQKGLDNRCQHAQEEKPTKKYQIDKIRMGDITGPCGNANCSLAHKVKMYIRNLEAYKKDTFGKPPLSKDGQTRKVCGACDCKDDRWHRDACKESEKNQKEENPPICKDCGGIAQKGETCEQQKNKFYGTGVTPIGSNSRVNYLISTTRIPKAMEAMFGKDFIVNNVTAKYNDNSDQKPYPVATTAATSGCCCRRQQVAPVQNTQVVNIISAPNITYQSKVSSRSLGPNNPVVYNVTDYKEQAASKPNFCLDIPDDKDCKCNPPKPAPPCKTLDCECITETLNAASRKAHKPFCPLYKHKSHCPVTMMYDEEDKNEFEEEEVEPLPYGLPPIHLGPCPVLGRPCSVPDGYARMYRTAAVPVQPPSYSDAGKVCCSKEYERIKKAIKEYMKYQKDNDLRCVNKYNVDTERRCCDKEQVLLSLLGKGCCGSHKIAIQEKYKDETKK